MKIIAHRCLRKSYTENSLEGYKACLDNPKIDGVEIDASTDQQGKIVVAHPKVCGFINGKVNGEYPTLEEFLKIDRKGKILIIEVKGFGQNARQRVSQIIEITKPYNRDNIFIMSYDRSVLNLSKELANHLKTIKLQFFYSKYLGLKYISDFLFEEVDYNCVDYISDQQLEKQEHRIILGSKKSQQNSERIEELKKLGVDGIMIDSLDEL